jgi:hypothetical protein
MLLELSSCGVRIEAPSFIHTKLVGFLFPEGHPIFLQNSEYRRGQTGSLRQMQTCVGKTCFPRSRAVAENSIDSLPELELHARARARRCLLHIVAMLRRPRTVHFQRELQRSQRAGRRVSRWRTGSSPIIVLLSKVSTQAFLKSSTGPGES